MWRARPGATETRALQHTEARGCKQVIQENSRLDGAFLVEVFVSFGCASILAGAVLSYCLQTACVAMKVTYANGTIINHMAFNPRRVERASG
jgi:hypothetical protein